MSRNQYAAFVMPIMNTGGQKGTLPAGISIAVVDIHWCVNDTDGTENDCKVQELEMYLNRSSNEGTEQEGARMLEDKLQHLSPKLSRLV